MSKQYHHPFEVGDLCRIVAVAFPANPDHACFVGKTGVVTRVFKTIPFVQVKLASGKVRDCYPQNLEKIEMV